MMQVSKKIPFEDPQVLLAVRAAYILSNVLIFGIYYIIWRRINSKKGAFATYAQSAYHIIPFEVPSALCSRFVYVFIY